MERDQAADYARGPKDSREALTQMRAELESLLQKVNAELGKLGAVGTEGRSAAPDIVVQTKDEPAAVIEVKAGRQRPVREVVLDALGDLDWLAYSREVALYCKASSGREIPPTRFGTLADDEMNAYRARGRPRPVWLCFGMTHDRHEPIKRLLARSDWPLERRIVTSMSGRIQHLKMTSRLCHLALQATTSAADPEMLKILAADHARDLPGVKVRRGTFDLDLWRDVADQQLAELLPEDEALRRQSAERLRQRDEYYQLFGAPDVIDGGGLEQRHRRGTQ